MTLETFMAIKLIEGFVCLTLELMVLYSTGLLDWEQDYYDRWEE
jgi:hypothetical protein